MSWLLKIWRWFFPKKKPTDTIQDFQVLQKATEKWVEPKAIVKQEAAPLPESEKPKQVKVSSPVKSKILTTMTSQEKKDLIRKRIDEGDKRSWYEIAADLELQLWSEKYS